MREPTEMELRCAKALCAKYGRLWFDHDTNQAEIIEHVRAVMGELRNMDGAMLKAGIDKIAETVSDTHAALSCVKSLHETWPAMVNAASPPEKA